MKMLLLVILTGLCANLFAQQFSLDKSLVTFFSDAAIEDITAKNTKSASIYNSKSDSIVFSIPIKEFKFAKSLMQEHFNEKYMESDKYKVSTFVGVVKGFNHAAPGPQQVKAIGKLTIHGVTKDVEIPGSLEIAKDKVFIKSKFNVKLEDYSIARPQILWQNIAEVVEVSVDFTYKPYEKK
jgi:hypothetical protein